MGQIERNCQILYTLSSRWRSTLLISAFFFLAIKTMAESIAYGVVQKIVTSLGAHVLQEIGSAYGVKKELRKLAEKVSMIKPFLLHAEEILYNNNYGDGDNSGLRVWVRKIKDAAYDAEDVIDDFEIELALGNKVRKFLLSPSQIAFRFEIARRIKEIRETLDGIGAPELFNLERRVEERRNVNAGRETHSYVNETNVYGREVNKEEILELVLDSSGQDNLSVIPIQGMGGIGKTTLAQLVYNDKSVVDDFSLRMWICVSGKFDVKEIVEKMIKDVTKENCSYLNLQQLQSLLRKELMENRFLLVLDDVWNEDIDKWEKLKDLLMVGAAGSKIIVTTRSEKVALIMGTISRYQLYGLSDEDCWKLFKGRAFKAGEEEAHPGLVDIGKDIVRKCGGVPLAAKTLGSVMCFKRKDATEWNRVRNTNVWNLPQTENDILPILRISYVHLPFYLRQCFAYCSTFPKDSDIKKEMLIECWIAQGFVYSHGENQSLEDIGNEYVEELMWRSFFQEPKADFYGDLYSFKMHDLFHDLAQSVAGVECCTVLNGTGGIPEGVRYLCVDGVSSSSLDILNVPLETVKLRELFSASEITSFAEKSFKYLRILVLESSHTKLPKSIGKLKHLRYLQIFSASIKTLPKSMTNLHCLRTMKLRCPELVYLPSDIGKLINLRHIDIEECTSLSCLPQGLKELTSLRNLSIFSVGKGSMGCALNELNGLVYLSGELAIKNLENVRNAGESTRADLKGKENLTGLELLWTETSGDIHTQGQGENIAFDVLQNLEPNPNLKYLKLEGYVGNGFPNWMMAPSLANVGKIIVSKCRNCRQLPPFSQLSSLKILELESLSSIRFIEGKTVKRQQGWFPSLIELHLDDLSNLESWAITEKEEPLLVSFSKLVKLIIKGCSKLMSMPLIPSVEKLELCGCSSELVHSLLLQQAEKNPNSSSSPLVSLKHLDIIHCKDLECLPEDGLQGLTSLRKVSIMACHKLQSLGGMDGLVSLQVLLLQDLPRLPSLPEELSNPTKLQAYHILNCPGLMNLPAMQHLTALQYLDILGCESLVSWPSGLRNLTSLRHISLSNSTNLPYLPQELHHLTALRDLLIHKNDFDVLPEWMVNLTSLRGLRIFRCRHLQFLPDWLSKLTALEELEIMGCDHLTSRCEKGTGEDWPKIAHVKSVVVSQDWDGLWNYSYDMC